MFKSMGKVLKEVLQEFSVDSKQSDFFQKKYLRHQMGTLVDTTITKDSVDFLKMIMNWNRVVGESLYKNSRPLKFQRGVLSILTKSPIYSHALDEISDVLKEKIEDVFPRYRGKIQKFRYQVSPDFFQAQEQREKEAKIKDQKQMRDDLIEDSQVVQHCRYSPHYRKATQEAEKVTLLLEDDELKNVLKDLYIKVALRS